MTTRAGAVGEDEHHDAQRDALAGADAARAGGRRQHVGRVLVEHRHRDGDELGDQQHAESEHHARAQVGTVLRPHER